MGQDLDFQKGSRFVAEFHTNDPFGNYRVL